MGEATPRPPVEDWASDFDHFDPAFTKDPYPILAELRDRCPVAHTDRYGGANMLTTFDDVSAAAHDTDAFTSRRIIISEVPTTRRGVILPPINLDPPHHTDPRRAMLPFFNPSNTKRWEEPIREICRRRLAEIEGVDRCDIAVDYARHIPGDLTALMFGVPSAQADQFRTWVHDLLEVGPTNADVERETTNAVVAYMHTLIEERRRNGGDDLVTYLLDQQADGDQQTEGETLNDENMAKMLLLLMLAGIDTTWSALGSSFLHLAENPDDRDRLVADPDLIPTATEEFLRAYSPVSVARIATDDAEISGCPVGKGEWVMLNFPAANRDPVAFDSPDEVRIDRARNRHAAFGLGVHRCLGSNLARLEMNIAIEMWLERHPRFALVDGAEIDFAPGTVRGPRNVPVTLG